MPLSQEDSFVYSPRQNYRSNIGLIENPMSSSGKVDVPPFPFQSHSKFDSLKRNNIYVGTDETSQQQPNHKNPSAGKNLEIILSFLLQIN